MGPPEDLIDMAERHIRMGQARIAGLVAAAEAMDGDGHPRAAEQARALAGTFERAVGVMRERLRVEREARGLEP